MNEEILKGKLVLGKNNNLLTINTDFSFYILDRNFILFDKYLKIALDNNDFFVYKDNYERYLIADEDEKIELFYDLNKSVNQLIDLSGNLDYCRDVNTYVSNFGNLNLINSGPFNQLTLDNLNNNIINSYSDLDIHFIDSSVDYNLYYKDIKLISKILDDNLDTNISKCCLYHDKSNSDF